MPKDTRSHFARRMEAARKAAGLTYYALARKCGISQMQLGRLERGERAPLLETARRIANALGLTLADFDQPEEKEKNPCKPLDT